MPRASGLRAAVLLVCTLLTACSREPVLRGTVLHDVVAPPFTLRDQLDRPFALAAQRGKAVVLFFGYTHCPDECPTTLAHLARLVKTLGPARARVRVAFITVDPARDTPAVLGRYVANFDPDFVGLSAAPAQLLPVLRAYHVWDQALPQKRPGEPYLVAHGTTVFLIDPAGRLRALHDISDSDADIAYDLRALLS